MRRQLPTTMFPLPMKWLDLVYNAADFTASTGNWLTQAGDVRFLMYALVGETVFIDISLNDTGNSDNTAKLIYQLPDFLISSQAQSPFGGQIVAIDGVHEASYVEVEADTGQVSIRRVGDTNWPAGSNLGVSVQFWYQLRA